MPIPRGGESTRKNTSEPFIIPNVEQKEFKFKY